jgi:hypothetical protein
MKESEFLEFRGFFLDLLVSTFLFLTNCKLFVCFERTVNFFLNIARCVFSLKWWKIEGFSNYSPKVVTNIELDNTEVRPFRKSRAGEMFKCCL